MEIQNHDFGSPLPEETLFWGDNVLYQFEGFWFPPHFLQGTKHVLHHFKPLPNDVILASFPKTGTTWLKSLIYSIVNRPCNNQLITSNPHELVPVLENQVYGGGPVANSPPRFPTTTSSTSPRIFSTHIPYQILRKTFDSSDCRVVYIARNPKDTVVSLWHFVNSMNMGTCELLPLDDIVRKFCKGTVAFGPYFEHVLGYNKESLERPEKFFSVTYEELKSDPMSNVKRLAEFLRCPFEGQSWEEQLLEVVKSCSIETLKNHEVNKSSNVPSWTKVPYKSFFRKGQVGDHTNYLTEDMIEEIDAVTRTKFSMDEGKNGMY